MSNDSTSHVDKRGVIGDSTSHPDRRGGERATRIVM